MATTPAAGGRVRQSVLPSVFTVYRARDPSDQVTQNMSGKAGFQCRPVRHQHAGAGGVKAGGGQAQVWGELTNPLVSNSRQVGNCPTFTTKLVVRPSQLTPPLITSPGRSTVTLFSCFSTFSVFTT